MSEAERDMENSASDFERVVAPVLSDWIGGSNVPVETVTDSHMADKLDTVAGVDHWHIKTGEMMYGVGSRIQYVDNLPFDTPPDTFTIRKERHYSDEATEYDKRLQAITEGEGLYPDYTTHAYLDQPGGELQSLAKVRTKDLILHIRNGHEGEDYFTKSFEQKEGRVTFFFVNWWYLNHVGVGIRSKKPYKNRDSSKQESQSFLGDFATDGGHSQGGSR